MVDLSRLAVQRPTTNDGRAGAVITPTGTGNKVMLYHVYNVKKQETAYDLVGFG
jgi:hypothetical protein